MNEKLLFRRQFILTKLPIIPLDGWQSLHVDQYYLYTHPDLEVNQVVNSQRSMVLFGSIFDPSEPEMDNISILKNIHGGIASLEDLFLLIKKCAGRYALLYKDEDQAIIMHDPLALREIYYSAMDNHVLCGSQPDLLIKYAHPDIKTTTDADLIEFYTANLTNGKWNPFRKWIGDETIYEGVKHLLPNHYLDLNKLATCRYWPKSTVNRLELRDAVSNCCAFLQGSIKAIAHRHSLMMAVTAGMDSRTLLAASRECKDNIYYFINKNKLNPNHPDILVPTDIFDSIGVPFHVHDVPKHVDDDFRKIFLDNTFFSSERILPTIYNVYYKKHSEKVNILGIGEIGRTRYGREPKKLDGYLMAYKLGHKDSCYAVRKGKQILEELLPVSKASGMNILTLLYWEHTLGDWGVTGNSESDIAIEEINPFDSHYLYKYGIYSILKDIKYKINHLHYRHLLDVK